MKKRKIIYNKQIINNFFILEKIYWLALGWWAARWLVHIWVIKYLEENNVKIWEIAGTSMWAIIWALLASWKNYKEIFEFCKELKNYKKFIDIDLIYWLIKWEKFRKKLFEYFWDKKIEDLPIKLKIIATDIESWELKVFEKGSIVEAIRASISIPWVFKPHKIWKNLFVDGMVVKNLPVDELTLENKIAVSAIKIPVWPLKTRKKILGFEIKKWFFELNYQILTRTFMNLIFVNEEKSIELSSWNIQTLSFEYGELDFLSFSELEKFVKLGYKEAKNNLKF